MIVDRLVIIMLLFGHGGSASPRWLPNLNNLSLFQNSAYEYWDAVSLGMFCSETVFYCISFPLNCTKQL